MILAQHILDVRRQQVRLIWVVREKSCHAPLLHYFFLKFNLVLTHTRQGRHNVAQRGTGVPSMRRLCACWGGGSGGCRLTLKKSPSGATQMPAVIPSACFLVQQLRVKNCVRRGWGRHSGALPPSNCFQMTSVSDSIKPGFTGEDTGPTPCTAKFQLVYLPR